LNKTAAAKRKPTPAAGEREAFHVQKATDTGKFAATGAKAITPRSMYKL